MILHLTNTRRDIEKFVYERGTNVALYNAEQSTEFKGFQSDCESALYAAIEYVAQYKTILPLLISLAKGPSDPLLNQVSTLVATRSFGNGVDLKAFLVWAGTQGGQAVLDKLSIDSTFGLRNQAIIDYFGNYANLRIDSVDETTKKWIAAKIQEGKDQGLTPFQIQQLLLDEGKGITEQRAEKITLYETAKAMTYVEIEAASRYGIQQKQWKTSRDEKVCPICGNEPGGLAELIVGVKENFKTDYGEWEGPPAHVYCRCYLNEIIPEGWVIPERIWIGE